MNSLFLRVAPSWDNEFLDLVAEEEQLDTRHLD